MENNFVREKCVRACWALPVFVKMSSFYVFSRLDLCVRSWKTRKNTSGSSVGNFFPFVTVFLRVLGCSGLDGKPFYT
jgi:hypothetical protein